MEATPSGKIKTFFNKPIDVFGSSRDKWLFVGFVSLFVTTFLLVFQPFGVNNFDPEHSIDKTFFFSMIGFGLVTGLVLSFFEFVIDPLLFKRKTLLFFIIRVVAELLLVATVVFIFYNLLGNFHDWYFQSYIDFIFNVSVMSMMPIAIVVLYVSNRKTKRAYQELELQPRVSIAEKYISLRSSNQKDSISLTLSDLLFVEAEDNYVSVSYLEKGQVKKQLLRTTMKKIEEDVQADFVVRCHRSFIVNMNKVERIVKEGHQIKLFIPQLSFPLLVSRSYVPKIQALLEARHK